MQFKQKILYFILFIFIQLSVLGQNKTDILEKQLLTVKEDSTKINVLLELSWLNRRINPLKSINYSYEALQLSKTNASNEKIIKSMSYIGVALRSAEYYQEAIRYFTEALELSIAYKIPEEEGFSYINLGFTYFSQKEYNKAEINFLKGMQIGNNLNSSELKDYAFTYLVLLYDETKQYEKALSWSRKVEPIKIKKNDSTRLGALYLKNSDIYFALKNYKQALSTLNIAIKILDHDTLGLYRAYSKKAIILLTTNNLSESLQLAQNAFDVINSTSSTGFKELDYVNLNIELCTTLIEIYTQKKDFKQVAYYQTILLQQKNKILTDKTTREVIGASMHRLLQEKENENIKLTYEKHERDRTLERRRFYEIGGLLIFVFLSVFMYILFKERQKLKEINQILHQQKDELDESNATKDKFFSIVAHDLKNPFHALLGLVEIMKENLKNDDKQHLTTILEYLTQTINAGYTLLENLLSWSQSQKGKIQYNPEVFSLTTLLNTVLSLMASSAKEKHISFDLNITENDKVLADKNMVLTVLRNLISNAIKFSYEHGIIDISAKIEAQFLKISITDKGMGIDPQNKTKIFEIAENVSTHGTLGEKGTGIGLPLCKEFVEKNKGKIGVESKINEGSVFWFILPLEISKKVS